ncbi:MAG TPA: tetratricopeptide repeat protein [Planctomycetota bacterium]|nr:tetratricopeptide repeat protein [Planctomycetota bacterium]
MSGQTTRWALAFAVTAAIAGAILASASNVPAPAAAETVPTRDPAGVSPVELELILNKIREGDLLAMKKDEAGAQRAWLEARRMGEGLWPIHEGLGDSYARAKNYEAALREYKLAAERVPEKFAAIKLAIGAKQAATIAAAGRPLDAIQAYLDLNQLGILGPKIFGLALEGDRVAAIRVLERHAEVYDARVYRLVAGVYKSMERTVDAAEALAKVAVRVEPWNDALNRPVIEELRKAGKFEAALEVGRAWVKAVPDASEGYQAIGDTLWDAGKEREALIAYSSIVDVKPADAAARRRLGEIYRRRNRPEEAMAQFEAGLKLSPDDAELRWRVIDHCFARIAELKKDGKADQVRELRRRLGEMKVQEAGIFDIKVLLTWDVASDVDMDVVEPDGKRINHESRSSNYGGVYSADNTMGFGPESYTVLHAKPGTYRVGAHLHSGPKSTVKFVVILFEDTPREERREETLVLERTGTGTTFIPEVVIPDQK